MTEHHFNNNSQTITKIMRIQSPRSLVPSLGGVGPGQGISNSRKASGIQPPDAVTPTTVTLSKTWEKLPPLQSTSNDTDAILF